MPGKKDEDRIDDLLLMTSKGKIYKNVIKDTEKMLVEKALKRSFGNQSIAAKLLGINRNTMRAKIKKFDIDAGHFKI